MSASYAKFAKRVSGNRRTRINAGRRRVGARARASVRLGRAMATTRSRGAVARAARSMLNNRTAGFLGIEKKFFDTSLAPTSVVAPIDCSGGEMDPSTTLMISTPAQGDTEQSRDGKRIIIKSVNVKGVIRNGAVELFASPHNAQNVFVALVLDTQTNGAEFNSEDVFKNLSGDATIGVMPTRNLLFANRFKVLKSEVFDLTPNTLSHVAADAFAFNGIAKEFDWYFPMDLPVNFNAGTTSSIANVIDNSLHMVAFASSTQGAIGMGYNARIRFMG